MTEKEAYDHGFDAGRHSPNTTNCNFRIFSKPKYTHAWEKGKAAGEAQRLAAAPSEGQA